jgi:hypothetical protein
MIGGFSAPKRRTPPLGSERRRFSEVSSAACLGLEGCANAIDRAGDSTREEPERHDHAKRNHSQNDAVLSHRLTLLDLEAGAEVMDQIRERHVDSPPFGISSARCAP